MKKAAILFMMLDMAILACPVLAQSIDGTASEGTTGSAFSNGDTTWQAQENTSIVPAAPVGQTLPTYDNILGNGAPGPLLAPAQSGGIAQGSVNMVPYDSGYYSLGFPSTPNSITTDSYVPPSLPMTSSGSVDANTADCPYCGQGPISPWGW